MRHLVITPCTDRKRHQPHPDLCARNLDFGEIDAVAEAWTIRVRSAEPQAQARSLYCGRAFKEAADAASLLGADHWIISAGLGLIKGTTTIPAYGLTVSPSGADSIRSRVHQGTWSTLGWWDALRATGVRKLGLAEVLEMYPEALVMVALSENYAQLLGHDLAAVESQHHDRLRIFGAGLSKVVPPALLRSLMPYDRRLDGPDSPTPGTMSDFATRALHHFSRLRKNGVVGQGSPETDTKIIQGLMRNWREPHVPQRQPKSNEQIRDLIIDYWDVVDGRSGQMLRYLRDELKVACEQGRFRTLFNEVAAQRKTREGGLA